MSRLLSVHGAGSGRSCSHLLIQTPGSEKATFSSDQAWWAKKHWMRRSHFCSVSDANDEQMQGHHMTLLTPIVATQSQIWVICCWMCWRYVVTYIQLPLSRLSCWSPLTNLSCHVSLLSVWSGSGTRHKHESAPEERGFPELQELLQKYECLTGYLAPAHSFRTCFFTSALVKHELSGHSWMQASVGNRQTCVCKC